MHLFTVAYLSKNPRNKTNTLDTMATNDETPDPQFLEMLRVITGLNNISENELNKPILRSTIQDTYILYIIQYALLSFIGVVANIWIIYYISRHKLYRDNTHAFFINLSVCHFVQSAFVVPITLVTTIVHNWILGQFMCFFVPMLQDIPLHAALLTHLLIAWDRMRWLNDPMNTRFPAFVCSCATWLTGMVIALPYPIYTTFLDLGLYYSQFRDVGICLVNLVDDSQEHTRGLFFLMYVAPSVILGYLYIHTARDLRPPEGELSVMMYEQQADIAAHRHQRHSTTSSTRGVPARNGYSRSYDLYDAQADASREQRTQFLLGTMAACEILCIGPLMVLRFARQQMYETYENSSHIDLTYLMLIWIAFLPCVISPCIYSCWILSGPTKDRIWRYFRLSSRRSDSDNKLEAQRSIENSITQENTTETLDIEAKMPLAQKSTHLSRATGKINPLTHPHVVSNALKAKKAANRITPNRSSLRSKNIHKDLIRPDRMHSSDDMNNSCSNITASTYINGNEVSTSSGIGVDFEASGIPIDQKSLCDRESVYSNDRLSHRSNDMMSESGNLLLRRESSSTYERDMDIIDLLERERSMDLQEIIEREKRNERIHKKPMSNIRSNPGYERRKLPDIAKITQPSSPKRLNSTSSESAGNFPNFVFTHQYNEFAEARINRNRDSNVAIAANQYGRSRNDSQTSFGKRNSDVYAWNDIDGAVGNVITRETRARSIDSRKSSTKSIHDNRIIGGIVSGSSSTNNYAGTAYANNL